MIERCVDTRLWRIYATPTSIVAKQICKNCMVNENN